MVTRYATLGPVLMLLSLAEACGTEFTACREGEPCKDVSTATGGSGAAGGSAGTGAGGSAGESAAGAGGDTLVVTSSTGGLAGEAGAPGAAGAPDTTTSGGTGGSGTGGSIGGNPPIPCDGACTGDTSVCNEETDTCVECLDNEDCETGVCDSDAHVCVECLEAEDCEAPTPLCDTEGQLCVECLGNTDCTSPQESQCDGGSCSPCQTNTDCAHLSATTVCDTTAGECVECTPENEAVCGGTSCNPATNTCTATELGTVGSCEPCLADSECIGNDQAEPLRRCVPMSFNGEPRDKAYCLIRRSQVSECARPFVVGITTASLSGAPEELYCGISQDNVTCEAVQDFLLGRTCPGGQPTECGCPRDDDGNCTAPGQGGLCRDFPTLDDRCTYECGNIDDCPSNKTCADQDPDFCQ